MLAKFLHMNQPTCIALWLLIGYNLAWPLPGLFYPVLLYTFPVLLVAHFFEWLALRGKLTQLGHPGARAFVMVMIYGFFWWVPIMQNSEPPPAQPRPHRSPGQGDH